MTSVRPRLKAGTPSAVTGWDTRTGRPVWLNRAGAWTHDVRELHVLSGDEADQALRRAAAQQGAVTEPYLMEVTSAGMIAGREALRESLRAGLQPLSVSADAGAARGMPADVVACGSTPAGITRRDPASSSGD